MIKGTDAVFSAVNGDTAFYESGIDLRTYIAIQVMAGYSANPNCWQEYTPEQTAKQSVECADLLIAELNKPTTEAP